MYVTVYLRQCNQLGLAVHLAQGTHGLAYSVINHIMLLRRCLAEVLQLSNYRLDAREAIRLDYAAYTLQ